VRFETYQFPSRRSNVIARLGMVATSQPLAAQAGLSVLAEGGNAVDAAIATAATLCVVEPCSTGIGGDAFALIWSAADRQLYGLNASGPAPRSMSAEWLRDQGHESMPQLGGLSVTVPGALRGWEMALSRFGTWSLDRLLSQAIDYAQQGFPVSQRIARSWRASEAKMSRQEASRRVWLPAGRAPEPGQLFRNPAFAATLRTLAANGADVFYQGDIAGQIVEAVRADGGALDEADLAAYQAEWVTPLSIPYHQGTTFHEIPPNGQGLTALLALSLARGFDLRASGYGTAETYHVLMESIKLAFADAAAYIGDPRHAAVPVQALLADAYTSRRRALIERDAALLPVPGRPSQAGDTVYLTVGDAAGNMVSWIQSLYMGFGSGLTAGTTGIQLHNRGANFTLEPGHPNEASPGKRPYNTIIPGFITRDGHAWCSFGVMGGFMQPQGHLQVGVNLVDFEMDPQSALDAPRFRWLRDRTFAAEFADNPALTAALAQRGHEILAGYGPGTFGGGQALVRDPGTGVYIAGSEPRNDGAAAGF
jgi:gamma-glutamyltranspeptidase/glutathione hydrolase